MKQKLLVVTLIMTFISGCTVCGSNEGGVSRLPRTEVSTHEWGSQKKLNMRANSKLRKGSAHGRVKMTKDRTSAMLSR